MILPVSWPYLVLGVNILMGVSGQFLIKLGVNQSGGLEKVGLIKFLLTAFTSPFILSGIFLYGLSAILWVIILSKIDLSVAYPSLSLGYILILLVSALFLGESVSAIRFLGVFLIVAGIVFIFRS